MVEADRQQGAARDAGRGSPEIGEGGRQGAGDKQTFPEWFCLGARNEVGWVGTGPTTPQVGHTEKETGKGWRGAGTDERML